MAELQFRLPAFDDARHEVTRPRRRAAIMGFAAAVTVTGLLLALYVGTLGYNMRRGNMHDSRLKNILGQTPTVYQVTEGLKEKAPLVLVVETPTDLDRAVGEWGAAKAEEIREKASRWPQLRVYAAGDMMYFIYFDESDIMRDYVYLST